MSEEQVEPAGAGLDPAAQRRAVRERYGAIAVDDDQAGCCDTGGRSDDEYANSLGYTDADVDEIESMLVEAGFVEVSVELEADDDDIVETWDDERDLSEFVRSARITGRKPADPVDRSPQGGPDDE